MPKVPYCGRSMFYQEAGEGPVLIFLHGNTASSRLFEPLLPLYTPHFRCVFAGLSGKRALRPGGVVSGGPVAGRGSAGPGPDPGGGL